MDAARVVANSMLMAIKSRNLDAFRAALNQGFDVRSNVRSKKASNSMPFVEKVARSRFSNALRILLVEMKPCLISREDAVRAFHASVKSGAPRTIITCFVDASILGNLPVLSLADSYRYAMEYHCSRLARRVIDVNGFDPNCCVQMFAGAWERPIHSAVKRNQYETATRLLQMGAEVDAPNCYGITALMMACGKVSFDSVKLLLAHGADPNSADGIQSNSWPLGATEFPGSMFNKPKIPVYPTFNSNLRRWRLTNKADKIIALLVSAGLRPTPGNWLQRTSVVVHMSRDAGQVLRNIVYKLPSLQEVAIVQSRQQIRNKMNGRGGPTFNEVLNTLYLPMGIKDQLTIDLLN